MKRRMYLILTGVMIAFNVVYYLALIILGNTTEGWSPIIPVMVVGMVVNFALFALIGRFEEKENEDEEF